MWSGDGLLPLYGFVVGVLVGLTGMGGGVIMTPLLIFGLGLPATAAVGTDLAYAAPTKILGGWQHWRQGTVDMRVVRDLATGSVPASLIMVGLLAWSQNADIQATDIWIKRIIGGAMIVAATLMIVRLAGLGASSTAPEKEYRRGRMIVIGIIGGALVGLTSIGSGSLIMAMMVLVLALGPDKLVGTDVVHAAVLVSTAAVAHLAVGDVNLVVAGLLMTGSIPGVLIGSRLVLRVPRQALRVGLALLLIGTGVPLTLL